MGIPSTTDDLETLLFRRGIRLGDLDLRSDGTVAPTHVRASVPPHDGPEVALPEGRDDVQPIDELGRGGMGVVHRARQRSLRREVALKRALDADLGDRDLVREARVLAHLAHPNVVPVHVLVAHETRPSLVMKRIVGTPWSERLESQRVAGVLLDPDVLDANLGVLLEVTRALEHAHRVRVLHLDLKPSNVMVGGFGEVYVLDWGLAAALEGGPTFLRPAASIEGPGGTVAYMAPEQALGDGPSIGVRTDVHLLGAMLHEVLTGEPRNAGAGLHARLLSAILGLPPTFPAGVPAALADIVRRATARRPEERFEDVAAFRDAVLDYLRHREVDALLERARAEFEALRIELASNAPDRERVFQRFGGVRFAVREVRARAPERAGPGELARATYAAMARFALGEGEIELAARYLEAHGDPPASLVSEVEAARADAHAAAQRVRRLEALARAQDLTLEREVRGRTAFFLAALFLVCNLVLGYLDRHGVPASYGGAAASMAAAVAIVVPYAIWRRRALFPNQVGTALWGSTITTWLCVVGHLVLGAALDVPFRAAIGLTPVHYMLCFGALATLFEARLWPAALLQIPTLVAAVIWPGYVFEVLGVGGAASVTWIGAVFVRRDA